MLSLFFCVNAAMAQGPTFKHLATFDVSMNTLDGDEVCMMVFDNKIFIQDEMNAEVDVYNANTPYNYIESFGSGIIFDSEDGIQEYNGFIFVTDNGGPGLDSIRVFNNTSPYNLVASFSDATINDIEGFKISCNKIFVADGGDDDIVVFDAVSPFNYNTSFGNPQLNSPDGITSDGSRIFVGDNDHIDIFDCMTYAHLGTSSKGGGVEYDEGLVYDQQCRSLLALDNDEDVIDVFSLDDPPVYQKSFGQGLFTDTECIAIAGNKIYVYDDRADEISIFECTPQPVPTIGEWGLISLSLILLVLSTVALKANRLNTLPH